MFGSCTNPPPRDGRVGGLFCFPSFLSICMARVGLLCLTSFRQPTRQVPEQRHRYIHIQTHTQNKTQPLRSPMACVLRYLARLRLEGAAAPFEHKKLLHTRFGSWGFRGDRMRLCTCLMWSRSSEAFFNPMHMLASLTFSNFKRRRGRKGRLPTHSFIHSPT